MRGKLRIVAFTLPYLASYCLLLLKCCIELMDKVTFYSVFMHSRPDQLLIAAVRLSLSSQGVPATEQG